MINAMFLNCLYIAFPILCYFIYLTYTKTLYEKEKMIFLDLAITSSFYLCVRFGQINIYTVLLLNVPILIGAFKKRLFSLITLSFLVTFYLASTFGINIFFFLILYAFIDILCIFTKQKQNFIFITFLTAFIISMLLLNIRIIDNIYVFVLITLFVYLYMYFAPLIFTKLENVSDHYRLLYKMSKEKEMTESLFKITHEIKNPLAVCKGYLEMFDLNDPKKATKYIGIIDEEVDQALNILKDFSNISKINVNKVKMDASSLLEDVCDDAKAIFDKNGVLFETSIDEEKEVLIEGDYDRLKQVFLNLIKNSKEASKKNGKVKISAKVIRGKYEIKVTDDGVGMDKETFEKIGTPFYTTKKNGTGLGVCFSKEIIKRHNGTINYDSKEGYGTMVTIKLPIIKAEI